MKRLGTKGSVASLALLAAAVLVGSADRQWLSGIAPDLAFSPHPVAAAGAELVPGLVALALVLGAGAIAAVSAGPRARLLALAVTGLAAVATSVLIAQVLLAPAAALAVVAKGQVGSIAEAPINVAATAWPYAALAAALLGVAAGIFGWRGRTNWPGPSARYERDGTVAGARGERVASDWDQLSAGGDPTDV